MSPEGQKQYSASINMSVLSQLRISNIILRVVCLSYFYCLSYFIIDHEPVYQDKVHYSPYFADLKEDPSHTVKKTDEIGYM